MPLELRASSQKGSERSLNFVFTELLKLIAEAVPEFRNYDMNRLLLSINTTRSLGKTGTWAFIVPLRYPGGNYYRRGKRGGQKGIFFYESPQISVEKGTALYILGVMVPRFFRLSSRERLETLVHELYHIHPQFRGDLRRFPRPHVLHGPTPKKFQKKVEELTDRVLDELPTLLQHPLLSEGNDYFKEFKRRRFSMPKLRFQAQSTLFSLLVGTLLLFLSPSLQANIPVEVQRSSFLKSSSQESSSSQGEALRGEKFNALKQSPDRQWVYLSGSSKSGWVRKESVRVLGSAQAAGRSTANVRRAAPVPVRRSVKSSYEDEALPDEDFLNPQNDFSSDKITIYEITKAGKLYENPSKFSNRFAQLESGDEVDIIQKSNTGKWTLVRLQITGEEGWLPSTWIKKISKAPTRMGLGPEKNTIEVKASFGPEPYGIGVSFSYYRDLMRRGTEANPTLFQVGAGFHYYNGSQLEHLNTEIQTKYSSFSVTGRYIPSFMNGKYFGFLEAGGIYHKASINTDLEKQVVLDSGLGLKETDFFLLLSAGAGMNITKQVTAHGGVQMFLKDSFSMFGYAGLGYKF